MAVTLISHEGSRIVKYTGLSSDGKPTPTDGLVSGRAGSLFYETDTKNTYTYNGSGFASGWSLTHIKGRQLTTDFYADVAAGLVPGYSLVHKYGRAPTGSLGTERSVSELGTMQFPSSASTMRIKAGGNAADTAAGTGAREVTLYGLDATGTPIEEAIATNGASASAATSLSFLRDYRARVTKSGTYITTSLDVTGDNQADIIIEDSGGVADYITIPQHEGTTEYAGYHVGLGQTAYMLTFNADVDASKNADVIIYQRRDILTTSAPVASRRVVHYFDGVQGNIQRLFKSPITFPALTDIWVNFIPTANGTECSADFELLVVDD